MNIGERIRVARKALGLTQEELGIKAGMAQSTISELERGDSAKTFSAVALAAALEVNAHWLETGLGRMEAVAPPPRLALVPNPPKRFLQWVLIDEAAMLSEYRQLTDDAKLLVMRLAVDSEKARWTDDGSEPTSE